MTGRRRRRVSAVRLRALAYVLLLAIGPLAIFEAGLRVFDVRPPWSSLFGAFFETRLFVPGIVDGEPGFRTNPAYLGVFQDMGFRADKGRRFRIMVAGGSFVHGWALPNPSFQAFPAQLGRRLETVMEGRPVEVLNCGGLGWGSSRIAPLVRELVRHQPDVLLVFAANNEFWESSLYHALVERPVSAAAAVRRLESSRTFALLGFLLSGVNSRWIGFWSDWTGRNTHTDDREYAAILDRYRRNLGDIVAEARRARVRLVLGTVPANLKCDPDTADSSCLGAARHGCGCSRPALARFDALVADAGAAYARRDFGTALARFRDAGAIDPGYSWVYYQEGRCLEGLGRWDEAKEAYWRHLDVCRRIVVRDFSAVVRELAAREGVPLVDAARFLESASPHGIPGYDWFADDAHLNLRGQRKLAGWLFEQRGRLLGGAPGSQNTVYMYGRELDPTTMSSAASSRMTATGRSHQAR